MRRTTGICLAALLALPLLALRPAPASPATPAATAPVPLLAYYYIWFDTRSWDRAKDDFPELGRYSSSSMARITRSRVGPATRTALRWTRDTVAIETPARSATS